MSRTLLLDVDLIAYRCTAAIQDKIDWNGDGSCVSIDGKLDEAKKAAKATIEETMDELKGHDLIVCLSDEVVNFRKSIAASYKSNRSGTERPVHLFDVKDWIAENYESCMMPRLEADDVMGILATEPHTGERVMVSDDKDMGTIPAPWCRPFKGWKVHNVTEEEATRFHLWQTLTGDQTDGYPGCPGCGPKAAEAILDDLKAWSSTYREITRGKRAGEIETTWTMRPSEEGVWTRILSAYSKAGQGEPEALIQARLAFILRHGSLDGGKIKLWTPPSA